jgi:hypothetical protein
VLVGGLGVVADTESLVLPCLTIRPRGVLRFD